MRFLIGSILVVFLLVQTSAPAPAVDDISVRIVGAFQNLFGSHDHYRPVHAKGIICEGSFTPAPSARLLSRAEHLQTDSSKVIVRFSDFAGTPTISDSGILASPRGMSIKFLLRNGADTDIVAHSYNGFPVSTPEDFLAFLNALSASVHDGVPGQAKLKAFAAAHPHAQAFLNDPMLPPESFATQSFYGVDAFKFTNAAGESRYGRYFIQPLAGEVHLTAAEAATRAPNFLFQDLAKRLGQKIIQFRIMVQVAEAGDAVTDAAVIWPKDRPMIELGILSIQQVAPDSDALQQKLLFTPMNVPLGIAGSGDPLLAARTRAYDASYKLRRK